MFHLKKSFTRHRNIFVASLIVLCSNSFSQTAPEASVSISNASTSTPLTQNLKNQESKVDLKEEIIKNELFSRPIIQGKLGVSLFTEDTYDGKNLNNQPMNSYSKAYILGNAYFTEDFYLSGNFRYSSSSGSKTTDNYFLDSGSAFIAELAFRYDADNYSLVAGHASVNYSLAKMYAAGMWGSSLIRKEYGVDGMMVLGGSYKIDGGSLGNHSVSATAFMVDTTALSDSFGGSRDPTPLSIGGPANTGKFNNFGLSVDGLKIKSLPKFKYQVAAVKLTTQSLYNENTNQPVASQFLANEQRYVVAAMWDKIDLASSIKLTPLFEYNRTLNAEGIASYDKSFYTGSFLFGYKQWNLGFSASLWDTNWSKVSNGNKIVPSNSYFNDRNNQSQIALGYIFSNGLKASIGYRKENKYIKENTQTIGINLKYDLPFAF
jgi:hypothetical protein